MGKEIMRGAAIFLLCIAASCSKPEKGGGGDTPSPSPSPAPVAATITIPSSISTTPTVSCEENEVKIPFTASGEWTAGVINTRADSWIDVSPKSGNAGSGEITISARQNDTYDERGATIQIRCGTVTKDIVFTQKQKDAIITTPSKVEFNSSGGSFTIEIKANIDYECKIADDCKDWITEVSTKGLTSKTLSFAVSENTGIEKREGAVIITSSVGTEMVNVYQNGLYQDITNPAIILTKRNYDVRKEGGTIQVEVVSNVDVAVEVNCDWITEDATKAVSTNTFNFTVSANEDYNFRDGRITFTNKENNLSENVYVCQYYKVNENIPRIFGINGGKQNRADGSNEFPFRVDKGKPEQIIIFVNHMGYENTFVHWDSENKAVATIDQEGYISAVNPGQTMIISTLTVDGKDYKDTCFVKVMNPCPEGAVDLGLNTYWGLCNLGASTPEEIGDYFAWGETETKTQFDWETYKWCEGYSLTKYNTESDFGTVDNITTLQLEDDAAYVRKGGNWHIPTVNEFEELYSNVNFIGIRDADNNIVGFKCVSRVNGNSFFLPTYSKKKRSGIINSWTVTRWYLGSYWLASLRSTPSCACTFGLMYGDSEVINGEYIIEDWFDAYEASSNPDSEERCKPHCIRPVSN